MGYPVILGATGVWEITNSSGTKLGIVGVWYPSGGLPANFTMWRATKSLPDEWTAERTEDYGDISGSTASQRRSSFGDVWDEFKRINSSFSTSGVEDFEWNVNETGRVNGIPGFSA